MSQTSYPVNNIAVGFNSGMNFVSRQSSCFASLDGMASLCSSDQLPKSEGATFWQLEWLVLSTSGRGVVGPNPSRGEIQSIVAESLIIFYRLSTTTPTEKNFP